MLFKRIFFTLILAGFVFYAPWWVALIGMVGGAFYFKGYYEMIILGVLFDILYGVGHGPASGYGMMGFVTTVILFLLVGRAKKELR